MREVVLACVPVIDWLPVVGLVAPVGLVICDGSVVTAVEGGCVDGT